MLIRYKGGRTSYKISPNRIPYIFNMENNMTLDITDQKVRDYIFSLDNREEFEVIEEEKEEPKPIIKEIEKKKEEIVKVFKKRSPEKEIKKKKGGKR